MKNLFLTWNDNTNTVLSVPDDFSLEQEAGKLNLAEADLAFVNGEGELGGEFGKAEFWFNVNDLRSAYLVTVPEHGRILAGGGQQIEAAEEPTPATAVRSITETESKPATLESFRIRDADTHLR